MAKVDISKSNQEKLKATSLRDSRKFAELMEYSPKAAAQYAIDCGVKTAIYGIPVEEYVKDGKKATPEKVKVTIEEEIEKEEPTKDEEVITKEELQELLKMNGIKFHHMSGVEKLTSIATENKLL